MVNLSLPGLFDVDLVGDVPSLLENLYRRAKRGVRASHVQPSTPHRTDIFVFIGLLHQNVRGPIDVGLDLASVLGKKVSN